MSATLAFYQLTKQNLPVDDPADPNIQIAVGEARTRRRVQPGGAGLARLAGHRRPGLHAVCADHPGLESDGEGGITPGYTGYHLFLAPRLQGSVWVAYEPQDGAWRGWRVGGGVSA